MPVNPQAVTSPEHTQQDWSGAVSVKGGYMRLEDFCNSTEMGNKLHITSGVIFMEEELLGIECGWRVANYVLEKEVTGWDALMDWYYAETMLIELKSAEIAKKSPVFGEKGGFW